MNSSGASISAGWDSSSTSQASTSARQNPISARQNPTSARQNPTSAAKSAYHKHRPVALSSALAALKVSHKNHSRLTSVNGVFVIIQDRQVQKQ